MESRMKPASTFPTPLNRSRGHISVLWAIYIFILANLPQKCFWRHF